MNSDSDHSSGEPIDVIRASVARLTAGDNAAAESNDISTIVEVSEQLVDIFEERQAAAERGNLAMEQALAFVIDIAGLNFGSKLPVRGDGVFDALASGLNMLSEEIFATLTERDLAREKLDDAQRIGRIGNFEFDVQRNSGSGSLEFYRVFGFDSLQTEFKLEELLEGLHPGDKEQTWQSILEAIAKSKHPETIRNFEMNYRLVHPDRSIC